MAKSSVKALHALIDELADAGKENMLTALHTILMATAESADSDGDLELKLDDEDAEDDAPKSRRGKKRRGGKSAKLDDEGDDDAEEDDDELNLGDLEVEDEDDDDAKPAKKSRRGGKKVVEDDEDDADDDAGADDADDADEAPVLKNAKGWEDFLDACDEFAFEPVAGGVRELNKRLATEFEIDGEAMPLPASKKELAAMSSKEVREMKAEVFGASIAKFEHVMGQLVALGDTVIEKIAEAEDIDLDEVTGKGKRRTENMAAAIVVGIYGDEEGDDAEDDGDDE